MLYGIRAPTDPRSEKSLNEIALRSVDVVGSFSLLKHLLHPIAANIVGLDDVVPPLRSASEESEGSPGRTVMPRQSHRDIIPLALVAASSCHVTAGPRGKSSTISERLIELRLSTNHLTSLAPFLCSFSLGK